MEGLVFNVSSAKGLSDAILMAQNAMLNEFTIYVTNENRNFATLEIDEIKELTQYMLSSEFGNFPNSQMLKTKITYIPKPLIKSMTIEVNVSYMCGLKDANELRCLSAMIASAIRQELGKSYDIWEAVEAYQKFINKYFVYQNTGNLKEHTTINFLKTGKGVCQAIASLATLVLPLLGVKTQYIVGEGGAVGKAGSHAWNAIKVGKRWVHMDFTFGMKRRNTPSTKDKNAEHSFRIDHRWDENHQSSAALSEKLNISQKICSNKICIDEKCSNLKIGDVEISMPTTILFCERDGRCFLDLYNILALVGGAYEYNKTEDSLKICYGTRAWQLENASEYVHSDYKYIDARVLNELKIDVYLFK